MEWPQNFQAELGRRFDLEKMIADDKTGQMAAAAKAMYAESVTAFVSDCVWLYEPRNANNGDPVRIPAVLFQRQAEFLEWMHGRYVSNLSGPVEKSRDSGASWMAASFAVWLWLFVPGSTFGFGSRKEILVDRKGDIQSLFEKIRSIIRHLPAYLRPEGLSEKEHFNHMRILNPENTASITGEAGDNIGRGGRTSVYVVDESAFIERPQMLEASLTATTDVRIDISSPSAGSLFDVWCATADPADKFIFDVRDAPWHTDAWIQKKRSELEIKGMGDVFRREYLRDSTAGIAGQLIPSDWVDAAVNACEKLGIKPSGIKIAALDVADGGQDRNALCIRHGIEAQLCQSWHGLSDAAGARAYATAKSKACDKLLYESTGVGAGAAAALRDKTDIKWAGWNPAGAVIRPNAKYEGNRSNADMFANAKSQAWWALRDRFLATYRAVESGVVDDPDDLISLSAGIEEIRELKTELSQVTYKDNNAGKVLIQKAPNGRPSPNRADSVMIAFAPEAVARVPSIMSI